MSREEIQIIRRTSDTWEITRVVKLAKDTHEYELIGRVVQEQGLFYAELPKWHKAGYEWSRPKNRGYLLFQGATKAITDTPPQLKE